MKNPNLPKSRPFVLNRILAASAIALVSVASAAADSRYTCTGKCVLFQNTADGTPLVARIVSLAPGKSDHSEEGARAALERNCAARATGTQYSMVVDRVLSLGGGESGSVSSSGGFGARFGFLGGVRGIHAERSASASRSQESSVVFSPELPRCTTNENVPQSDREDYFGTSPVGG